MTPLAARPGRFDARRLFRPASVAVVGEGPDAARVLDNLSVGYRGAVLRASAEPAAVAALPQAPDLAVLCTGPGAVPAALAALAARGTGAVVVTAVMPALQEALPPGLVVLGAGSFGLCVPALGLNASVSHVAPRPGRAALVSQSTSLCRAVLDWAEPNGVGFSHVVGLGSNHGLGFDAVLDWLSRDADTGVILLDLRRLQDRRGFVSAARAASRLRPVVAIRPGGRLLDADGTAEAVFVAALSRAGILCVDRLEDLLAAAETLSRARPARRDALAIVTNSTSLGRLAADAALRSGIALAALPPEARAALAATLPVAMPDALDGAVVHVGDAPTRLAEAAAMLCARPEVGGVVAVLAPTGDADAAGVAALLACAATVRQPLLVCAAGETTGRAHRRTLAEGGLPAFATPEEAVRGFGHLVGQRRARAASAELPPATVPELHPDRARVAAILAGVRAEGRLGLFQDESLAVLAAYGVPVPPSLPARDPGEAAAAARTLGFPVVLKRRRDREAAPGRAGSVALDLHDEAAVRAAAARLLAAPAVTGPAGASPVDAGAPPDGDAARPAAPLLVQRQAPRARELRVAVTEDPLFGPAIAFGAGGSAADALAGRDDVAFDLPPLNLPLARALVGRTRAGATLTGRAELPDADADALAEALVRVSQLVVDEPQIATLELNPLLAIGAPAAGAPAAGVLLLDAFLRLRPPGELGVLAIAPYPNELVEPWQARTGERFLLRPIRPEDAEAHAALFRRLPPEDVRFRFFSAVRVLSAEQMARLTQVDYTREMALVAERRDGPGAGSTAAVARLVRQGPGTGAAAGREAEFAVAVEPDGKGLGLGSALMRRLLAWGARQGLERVTGLVLAENAPMVAFARRLGFTLSRTPDDPEVLEAAMRLGEADRPGSAGEGS